MRRLGVKKVVRRATCGPPLSSQLPALRHRVTLMLHQLGATAHGQIHHSGHLTAVKAATVLGGSLDLNEPPAARVRYVHVHSGPAIVRVVEIESDFPVHHVNAYCGQLVCEGASRVVGRRIKASGDWREIGDRVFQFTVQMLTRTGVWFR